MSDRDSTGLIKRKQRIEKLKVIQNLVSPTIIPPIKLDTLIDT